jgi:hypothetical protein
MKASMMPWRMATLNLEQNHKRSDARRELVIDQLAALQPDVVALNEICLFLQTGRWLQRAARERLGVPFALVQQSKVNGSSLLDGEALLTRYPVVETANWDYRTLDMVAQVVRLDIEGQVLDVYVTHLYRSRGDDALRLARRCARTESGRRSHVRMSSITTRGRSHAGSHHFLQHLQCRCCTNDPFGQGGRACRSLYKMPGHGATTRLLSPIDNDHLRLRFIGSHRCHHVAQ